MGARLVDSWSGGDRDIDGCAVDRRTTLHPAETLRPPFAYDRIERRPEGLVRIALKRAFADGTLAVEMDPGYVAKLGEPTDVPARRCRMTTLRQLRDGVRGALVIAAKDVRIYYAKPPVIMWALGSRRSSSSRGPRGIASP